MKILIFTQLYFVFLSLSLHLSVFPRVCLICRPCEPHKRTVWLFETGLPLCLADFDALFAPSPPPPPKEALRWFLKGSHEDFPFKPFLFSLATHGSKCILFILYRMCVVIKVIYSITYINDNYYRVRHLHLLYMHFNTYLSFIQIVVLMRAIVIVHFVIRFVSITIGTFTWHHDDAKVLMPNLALV